MARKEQSPYLSDSTFSFEDTSVLMFRTDYPNYRFVMELNNAHGLELSRVEDLWVDGTEYPCFSFNDEYNYMAFVMIERSSKGVSDKVFDYNDKLLLARGRDAWNFQQHILNNLARNLPEPNPANLLEHRQWVLTKSFNQRIFSIDSFGFRQSQGFTTSLYTGSSGKMPKATANFLNRLHTFLTKVFDALQYHLCDDSD